jgi:hypothetical protein
MKNNSLTVSRDNMLAETVQSYPNIIMGIYNEDGKLIKIMRQTVEQNTTDYPFAISGVSEVKSLKVFIWEDLNSLLENMLKINKCQIREYNSHHPVKYLSDEIQNSQNYYTNENKYTDGERFQTFLYHNTAGRSRVCFTLMKNMPHGAVYDESRAAWEFLKRFSRPNGSKRVIEIQSEISKIKNNI